MFNRYGVYIKNSVDVKQPIEIKNSEPQIEIIQSGYQAIDLPANSSQTFFDITPPADKPFLIDGIISISTSDYIYVYDELHTVINGVDYNIGTYNSQNNIYGVVGTNYPVYVDSNGTKQQFFDEHMYVVGFFDIRVSTWWDNYRYMGGTAKLRKPFKCDRIYSILHNIDPNNSHYIYTSYFFVFSDRIF